MGKGVLREELDMKGRTRLLLGILCLAAALLWTGVGRVQAYTPAQAPAQAPRRAGWSVSQPRSESTGRASEDPFWERYEPLILVSGAGSLVLLGLVLYLLGLTRKLYQTRQALADLNATLETQVRSRTTLLNEANTQLQEEVSERGRMEAALRESESLKNAVINSLNAHIAVVDADGMLIAVNTRWREFALANGVSNLIGTVEQVNYLEVLRRAERKDPQGIGPVLRGMEEVLTGVRAHFEWEYPCDSCTEKRWFNMVVVPLANSQGGLVITHEDISLRKWHEQALQESKSSLQAVLYSTADGILAVNHANQVLFANERFLNMWKIPAAVSQSMNDMDMLEYVLEQLIWPQEFLEQVQKLYQSEQESSDVLYFKDGRVFERLSHPLILNEKDGGRVWSFLDITEQKRAEEQLRQSEEKFRSLLDSQESNIMMVDSAGVYRYVNQRVVASLGSSAARGDILGKRLHDLYPAPIADWQLGQIRRVFSSREGISGDFELAESASSSWWHLNIQPIRGAAGEVELVMINSLDITERKRAEQALRESEDRISTIFRLSPIMVGVSTAAEGRYTDVNDAFEQGLGYSKAEVIGRTSADLNIWADERDRAKILREIQAYGRVKNFEVLLRRKSGEIFPGLMFITPITLHGTACLLAMVMDITERKQSEQQLRETRDALQTIIHSSPLAILALDPEDHVTIWNPSAEEMFGWSEKQILGEVNPTVPENKTKEYDALRQATLNGMAFSNLDTVRQKKNGAQFPVSLSVAPLRGQGMKVIGRMHILADITERKKLQEELRLQATTDDLTRVANRRHFLELADRELKRALRHKTPSAIALMDLDHFKQINDTYGHAAGDQALIGFSQLCQKYIREIDVFARFGGDEFVMLLPETNLDQAYEVVERVRLALADRPIFTRGSQQAAQVALTISSGVSCLSAEMETIDMLIRQADQALYRAKETGRNRVIRFDQMDSARGETGQ
jgi:diguanylate cyclase (GGDEF)-like protein/PAS domain S-box-containing protein